MNHLLNLLEGFSSVFDFSPFARRSYDKSSQGFAEDQKRLRGDFARSAADLTSTLEKHGETAKSSGNK